MIRMKLHGGCTLSPVQLQKERLKALGIMMERAVRTGKYKSTVLNWAIVVPSRYCSEWIASARLQRAEAIRHGFRVCFIQSLQQPRKSSPEAEARPMWVSPRP